MHAADSAGATRLLREALDGTRHSRLRRLWAAVVRGLPGTSGAQAQPRVRCIDCALVAGGVKIRGAAPRAR